MPGYLLLLCWCWCCQKAQRAPKGWKHWSNAAVVPSWIGSSLRVAYGAAHHGLYSGALQGAPGALVVYCLGGHVLVWGMTWVLWCASLAGIVHLPHHARGLWARMIYLLLVQYIGPLLVAVLPFGSTSHYFIILTAALAVGRQLRKRKLEGTAASAQLHKLTAQLKTPYTLEATPAVR